jgi:hypothetical protein
MRFRGLVGLVAVASTVVTAPSAWAQLGSGWVSHSPVKKIHLDDEAGLQIFDWTSYKSVCSPVCADYRYDSGADTETFRLVDNRTNRSEIRLQDNYTGGSRQFQGYVTFSSPLDDESLMQVFGSTTGATQMMIRGYAASGGSLNGGGATLATNVYGVETRVNVIHMWGNTIRIYINGSQKAAVTDGERVSNYHKYGCYGTLRTPTVSVRWRQARFFRDGGLPGSGGTPTPTPRPTATPGPGPTATPAPTATPGGGGFSGYYRLTPRHSGKAVAVQSASTANSANVFQWTYGGSNTNDEWQILSIGSGYYRVIARHSGKDMTVASASTAEGADIFQYTYGGTTTNDEWAIVDVGSGYHRITNRHSGKSAEVVGGGTGDGADVAQRTYSGAAHQQFQLVSVP